MKNNYVLTVRFSTKQPIDKLCGVKTFDLIQEIGNAIRKVFDIYQLDIKSSCLKMDEPTLAKQDKSGRWYLPKLPGRNHQNF